MEFNDYFVITFYHSPHGAVSIGVTLFWEAGANPNQEWAQWFSTFKLAVMAKENLKVKKLLRTKPTPADLFYPTMPSLEDPRANETQEETRKGAMNVKQ